MDSFIAVTPSPDPQGIHIPGWVVPAGSIIFSVIATSVTITFFLSRLENRLEDYKQELQSEIKMILLRLEFKDANFEEVKTRLGKLESNFNQLVRYVNRGNKLQSFTPRNTSDDELRTLS